jgi:antitoxin component YwqK of YwqJK toxin-antitoxin module
MKKGIIILLINLAFVNSTNSQKYRILSVTKQVDHSRDFNKTGYCYDLNKIIGDTLVVQFYTQNIKNVTKGVTDSFSYHNDILNFHDAYKVRQLKDSIFYNPKTKKKETLHMYESVQLEGDGWHLHQKRTYTLVGFKKAPSVIQYNDVSLCGCPNKPLKFELYKNDTINMLNANGLKEGVWIEFYSTGEIMKRKRYKNGNPLGGYLYDKTGKVTHIIQDTGVEISEPIE